MSNETKKLQVQAQAVATVVIELGISAPWSGNATLEDVYRQAECDIEERIRSRLTSVRIKSIQVRAVLVDKNP